LNVYETPKFRKQRTKLKSEKERSALKNAVQSIVEAPLAGKQLKGEFKDFRGLRYFVEGQEQRLIYKIEGSALYLLSFGPREGVYQ